MSQIAQKMIASVNRLAKWRMVFTGWQLGTRTDKDPEAQAVRDHREVTIMLRAEVNAINILLIKKGVYTLEEFQTQLTEEADLLNAEYQKKFPGFRATDSGMTMNAAIAADTTRGWRP